MLAATWTRPPPWAASAGVAAIASTVTTARPNALRSQTETVDPLTPASSFLDKHLIDAAHLNVSK